MVKTSSSKTKNQFKPDYETMKKAAIVLRAINHKVRQNILNLIHKNKELSVSEIYSTLRLEQSVTSAHLAILRKADFVRTRREGQSIFYSINYERFSEIEAYSQRLIK